MPEDSFHLGWWRYFLFLQMFLPAEFVSCWNNKSALWTMSAFAFFYFLAPIIHKMMHSCKKAFFLVVCFIGVSFLASFFMIELAQNGFFSESFEYLSVKSPFVVLWIFLVGGAVFRLSQNSVLSEDIYRILIWGGVTIAILGLIYNSSGMTIVSLFALILYMMQNRTYDMGYVCNAVARKLDSYSYSIYLSHTSCLEIFSFLRDTYDLNMIIIAIGSVSSTIVLSFFLHNLIEKPVKRYFSAKI